MPGPPQPPCPPYIISGIIHYNSIPVSGATILFDNLTTPGTPYTVTTNDDGSFVINLCNISAWSNGDSISIKAEYNTKQSFAYTTINTTTYPVGRDIGILNIENFIYESLSQSDTLTVAGEAAVEERYYEMLVMYDTLKTKAIEAVTYKIIGNTWKLGSETPEGDVTVHILNVSPRGNLVDYVTKTDSNGYFEIEYLPPDEYVVVAIKTGFTLGWKRLTLSESTGFDLYLTPISEEYVVERFYNQYGHIYKIYTYKEEETETQRKIWGIIAFGDLYDSAADESVPSSGSLESLTANTTLTIQSTESLDNNAFFDSNDTLTQQSTSKISWTSTITRGDFDGFTFYIEGPKESLDIRITFDALPPLPSIPVPSPPSSPPSSGNSGSSTSSSSDDYPRPVVYNDHYVGPAEHLTLSATLFTTQVEDDILMIDLKETWHLADRGPESDTISFTETLTFEPTSSTTGTYTPEGEPPGEEIIRITIDFSETLSLTEALTFLPDISITGQAVYPIQYPGYVLTVPIQGATVIAYYKDTFIQVGTTTTDGDGIWVITDLPSHKNYDIRILKDDYVTITGTVYTHEYDIIEERARTYLKSETFITSGTGYYYESINSFPYLYDIPGPSGTIFGHVYNKRTGTILPDTFITATDISSEREYGATSNSEGYYSVTVPTGTFHLIGNKHPFNTSPTYDCTIASDWEQDIYLDQPSTITTVPFHYQKAGLRFIPI